MNWAGMNFNSYVLPPYIRTVMGLCRTSFAELMKNNQAGSSF